MPSFDVVSEIDQHELVNAIDQANREINNRFDFKGTNSKVELSEQTLLKPMIEINYIFGDHHLLVPGSTTTGTATRR